MKIKLLFINVLALILVTFGALFVSADANLTVVPVYDYDLNKLTVSGVYSDAYMDNVTILVAPYTEYENGLGVSDINNNKNIIFDSVRCKADGTYLKDIYLPDDILSDKYVVVAGTNSGVAKWNVTIVNKTSAESILLQINQYPKTGEASGFAALITDKNSKDLGIDYTDYIKHSLKLSAALLNNRPDGGYDLDTFIKNYNIYYMMLELKSGNITLDKGLYDYKNYTGVDYDLYKTLSDKVKSELEVLIKRESLDNLNFSEMYEDNKLLASVRTSEGYEKLKEVILSNYSRLKIDLDNYNSISDDYHKDLVFSDMFDYMKDNVFDSIADVKDSFDDAVAPYVSNGGGGGGGGGGGSVGNYDVITDIPLDDTQTPDDIKSAVFGDVESHWACYEITKLAKTGAINGYTDGTFKPDQTVTRAEFVKMVAVALELKTDVTENIFSDVNGSEWFAKYVGAAVSEKIVSGFNGRFYPNDAISRQDAAVIIYNAMSIASMKEYAQDMFVDCDKIADYAVGKVGALAYKGIVKGYEGYFNPTRSITRAEAAVMILNMLERL